MKIYFIGIGGIGVSALAQYYLSQGEEVYGSDVSASEIINLLKARGAKIKIGSQIKENIEANYDLVIYSPAVKESNPELAEAKTRGLKCLSYPQALGELTKNHFTIAISGTHGKSTTTAMIALILIKAGLDPTVIVGTRLKEFGDSNFRLGHSKYLVIEACEHEASFLNYWPQIGVILNIEEDHLDYYKTLDNIEKAFNEFANHIPKEGIIIKNKNASINAQAKIINFSAEDWPTEFQKIKSLMKIPGEYNVLNGLAALLTARQLNIPDEVSLSALSEYTGAWRRFSIVELPNYTIIDDYAHHPTEIEATIKAAREKYPAKKILCVFQPHQYQRTQFLWDEFIETFQKSLQEKWIDKLILIDIYDVAGREGGDIKKSYNSKIMAEKIGLGCEYINNKNSLEKYFEGFDIVIMMGAGDVYNLSLAIQFKYLKPACAD